MKGWASRNKQRKRQGAGDLIGETSHVRGSRLRCQFRGCKLALQPPLAGGAIDLVRDPVYAVTRYPFLFGHVLLPVLDADMPTRYMNHSSQASLSLRTTRGSSLQGGDVRQYRPHRTTCCDTPAPHRDIPSVTLPTPPSGGACDHLTTRTLRLSQYLRTWSDAVPVSTLNSTVLL